MNRHLTVTSLLGLAISGAVVASMTGCGTASDAGDGADTTSEEQNARPAASLAVGRGVVDPGVRGGAPGAGTPIDGLNANELALFNEGRFRTMEVEATCDTCNDLPMGTPIPANAPQGTTNSAGLGARFNADSCTLGCHSYPSIGGSSPLVNPSFTAASNKGATNKVPFFETLDGPTREVRFLFNPDGTRDGGVHQKFTVAGRSDAPYCSLAQPDFQAQKDNLAFRIPTPMFGLGFLDSIQDLEILAHQGENAARKKALGIHGVTNNSPNDGTISRFGWKAQNKSITQFAGEAYNVEMGITNDLDPQSKTEDDQCNLSAEPSDLIHTSDGKGSDPTDNFNKPIDVLPVWMTFTTFLRYMDQPKPAPFDASAQRGLAAFTSVGCSECHTPSMKTKDGDRGPRTEALKGKVANLFSDVLIHHMGATLADNIIQGNAGPDMFRTAPLWGVGQRLFFLHDGRARTLTDAILAHHATATKASGNTPAYPASEANAVVEAFVALPPSQQQDILQFLRSL